MENLIKYLEDLLEFLEWHNKMAPFPVYDTDYVLAVRKGLQDMKNNKSKYDDDPVTACRHCLNLFIVVDDVENDVCMNCGSLNELRIFKDIFEYLETVQHGKLNENN